MKLPLVLIAYYHWKFETTHKKVISIYTNDEGTKNDSEYNIIQHIG